MRIFVLQKKSDKGAKKTLRSIFPNWYLYKTISYKKESIYDEFVENHK